MLALQALYVQNPFWLWLAVGALFVSLDIALGSGKLIGGAVAAALLAVLDLAGVRLGSTAELALFVGLLVAGSILVLAPWRRRTETPEPRKEPKSRKGEEPLTTVGAGPAEPPLDDLPPVDEARTGRLIGRIGRTTSAFSNGVGRVWVDGAEWGADLDGEETLPANTPVRIMGVTGGVRLQVRNPMA